MAMAMAIAIAMLVFLIVLVIPPEVVASLNRHHHRKLQDSGACSSSKSADAGDDDGMLVVMGASMVDVGENAEAMPLRSAAEFPPYGVDYFHKPAARFSNGRVISDFLSQGLGYGLLDPYLRSIGSNFSRGVNFASSGSTARNTTVKGNGTSSGGLFSFSVQIDQYKTFRERVLHEQSAFKGSLTNLPSPAAISNAVHFIATANNDYISALAESLDFDPDSLVASVISVMEDGIKELHGLGARTILVMNVIPLGCTPGFLSLFSASNAARDSNRCIASVNGVVDLHNTELRRLIGDLREELASPNLVLFDANAIYTDAVRHPSKYGVKYPFETCCGAGGSNNFISSVPCGSNGVVNGQMLEAKRCNQPSEYISWDGLHPVESFAKHIADGVLTGTHLIPSISIKKALCKP